MSDRSAVEGPGLRTLLLVLVWVWVGVPFAWGLYYLTLEIPALFGV